eukprot:13893412-Heterocapsa_arctica.AAC.1
MHRQACTDKLAPRSAKIAQTRPQAARQPPPQERKQGDRGARETSKETKRQGDEDAIGLPPPVGEGRTRPIPAPAPLSLLP